MLLTAQEKPHRPLYMGIGAISGSWVYYYTYTKTNSQEKAALVTFATGLAVGATVDIVNRINGYDRAACRGAATFIGFNMPVVTMNFTLDYDIFKKANKRHTRARLRNKSYMAKR